MRSLVFVVLSAAAGCSGEGAATLSASAHCGPLDTLRFPSTQVGQTSNAIVQLTNTGGEVARRFALAIDGRDAAEFSIQADDSSCVDGGTLAVDDFCVLHLQLEPGAVGDKQATLHFGGRTLALSGTAVAPSTGLFVRTANLDFLAGAVTAGTASFVVSNQGGSTITLSATGDLQTDQLVLDAAPCAALGPGGACTVNLGFAQLAKGCVAGEAHLVSDAGSVTLPVTSELITIPGVTIESSFGAALGRVTSSPAGIDCKAGGGAGSICAKRLDVDAITYTAIPEPGHHFNGWSDPRCGLATDCTVAVGPLVGTGEIRAELAPPEARAIHITFAGDGTGSVSGFGTSSCNASCTVYVQDGSMLSLQATASSQLGGWSGGCTGATSQCDLGLIVNDRDVTVTFIKDPHELATTLAPPPMRTLGTHAASLPGGDLIISFSVPGIATLVARTTPSAQLVWSRLVTGEDAVITTTPSGAIYALGGPHTLRRLVRLTGDGVTQWSVTAAVTGEAHLATVGEDVIIAGDGLEVRAVADGALRWSQPLARAASAVAGGPDVVAVAVGDQIVRYTAGGTPIAPALTAPSADRGATLAYDAAGNLVVLGDGLLELDAQTAPAILTRFTPGGTVAFSVALDATGQTGGGALAITRAGKIAVLRMHRHRGGIPAGGFVESYTSTGTREWSVDKLGAQTGPGLAVSGFLGGTVLPDAEGGVVLVGRRDGTSFIERFAP